MHLRLSDCDKDPSLDLGLHISRVAGGRKALVLAIGPGHSDMKTDTSMSYILISYQIIPPVRE